MKSQQMTMITKNFTPNQRESHSVVQDEKFTLSKKKMCNLNTVTKTLDTVGYLGQSIQEWAK